VQPTGRRALLQLISRRECRRLRSRCDRTTNHVAAALTAFGFCVFAISWAWINFTWSASAYDTDDWIYRLMAMVQMVGVIVLFADTSGASGD
jgi:low temperature requirement protein LtrA